MSGTRRGWRAVVLALAAAAAAAAGAPEALAQRSQWTDMVYVPGRWQDGRLVRATTRNPATDSLALVMRVDYFANPPRWRAEIRRSTDGQTLGEPEVLLGNRTTVQIVTRVGATPLAQHAAGRDTLVRAAAAVMSAAGRRQGVASGRFTERAADGSLLRVAFRRTATTATFDDRALDPRNASAGSRFVASRIAAVGDQRSAGVVASAGARGVDRVRTPGGEVPVTPDTLAVLRMERYAVGAMRLEEFMRHGGLGPYKPAPTDSVAADTARTKP